MNAFGCIYRLCLFALALAGLAAGLALSLNWTGFHNQRELVVISGVVEFFLGAIVLLGIVRDLNDRHRLEPAKPLLV